MPKRTLDDYNVICKITDTKTGKTVELDGLSEKKRVKVANELTLRGLRAFYGPDWEVVEN